MLPLKRQDVPPRAGPDLWVLRLKAADSDQFVSYSPEFWGVWVHWNGRTTEPCTGEKKTCNGHRKEMALKWKGYLHCFSHKRKQAVFLEFTPAAAQQLLDQVGDGTFRGLRFRVERGKGDKARMKVCLLPTAPTILKDLPAAKDPYETLAKLWGVDDIGIQKLDQPAVPFNREIA